MAKKASINVIKVLDWCYCLISSTLIYLLRKSFWLSYFNPCSLKVFTTFIYLFLLVYIERELWWLEAWLSKIFNSRQLFKISHAFSQWSITYPLIPPHYLHSSHLFFPSSLSSATLSKGVSQSPPKKCSLSSASFVTLTTCLVYMKYANLPSQTSQYFKI